MIFTTVLLIAGLAVVLWRWPRYRRQALWGAIFTGPIWLIEICSVGSLAHINSTTWSAIYSVAVAGLNLLIIGAMAAVAFEALINSRLTPSIHQSRHHLKVLLAGLVVAIIAAGCGWPMSLAVTVGLLLNGLIILIFWRDLIWDALFSALGFALWFGLADILFAWRVAGDAARWQIGPESLGLTLFGLPIERVLVVAAAGALISPLFSAFKHRRQTDLPLSSKATTPKILISSMAVVIMLPAAIWLDWEYVEPPAVVAIGPISGSTAVAVDQTLSINFSRPVNRDSLDLTISPAVSGAWTFTQPAIGKHGYRQASYQAETTFLPGTTYTGRVKGIRSTWGIKSADVTFSFTTAPPPEIVKLTGLPFGSTAAVDVSATPLDPCQPLTAQLAAASDDTSEWTAVFNPVLPVTTAIADNRQALIISPIACFSPGTYQLRIDRRSLTHDRTTQEVVAKTDPVTVFTATIVLADNKPVAVVPPPAAPIPASAPLPAAVAVTPATQVVRQQKILDVKIDYQDQPLSCEAAALKMALAAHGVKVTETQIMKYVGYDLTLRRNGIWGDPEAAFVGSISGKQNTTGYGVHWTPIKRAADHWRATTLISNGQLTDLTAALEAGNAIVIWGTFGNAYRDSWKTPSGRTIAAWKGEHARTVIGYIGSASNPSRFIVNDPIAGRLTWTAATLTANWASFNNSGVVVE